jgi:Protein of unknown function (DUF1566)
MGVSAGLGATFAVAVAGCGSGAAHGFSLAPDDVAPASSSSTSSGGGSMIGGDSMSDGTASGGGSGGPTGGTNSGSNSSGGGGSGSGLQGGSGSGSDSGSTASDASIPTGPSATGPDGGAPCPSLAGVADNAFPRWPMPNPPAAKLPNPFTYTDLGNGTVRDDVTHLVWQKTVDKATQTFTWADAPAYCGSLTLPAPAGYAWHVPTRIQALSLVDYTTSAAMDGPFLGSGQPPGGMYTWTSTPWVVSQIATKAQDAWIVNFGGGGGLTSNAGSQSSAEYVRCVASPPVTPLPYPHYVEVGPGEVGDVLTGLIWVQASHLVLLSQGDAIAYCASLGLNGHTWRLPSVNELSSLVDDNPPIAKVSPAIDKCVFADTAASTYYMSSSTIGTTPWALNYEDGFDSHGQTAGYVRCVR